MGGKKLKVVDLFCGGGGLSSGFEIADEESSSRNYKQSSKVISKKYFFS